MAERRYIFSVEMTDDEHAQMMADIAIGNEVTFVVKRKCEHPHTQLIDFAGEIKCDKCGEFL